MKIVVIGGGTRLATVERLRTQGHDVVAAALNRRVSSITEAPRDPGYAGRPLREFLEKLWFSCIQPRIGTPAGKGREDGIR